MTDDETNVILPTTADVIEQIRSVIAGKPGGEPYDWEGKP